MTVNPKLEIEAYARLANLLKEAEQIRLLFDQARSPLPDALQRIIRSNGHASHMAEETPAPFKPPVPADVDPDWIWVSMKEATAGTIALALLRELPEPPTVRELHKKVQEIISNVSVGTIANVGTRAEEAGIITRDEEGRWALAHPEKVAMIRSEFLWGPVEVFQATEVASLRRNAIVHLLEQSPVGLQQSQILAHLRQHELARQGVPVNKALIKGDMEAMEGDRVRRRGNSKKWEAI